MRIPRSRITLMQILAVAAAIALLLGMAAALHAVAGDDLAPPSPSGSEMSQGANSTAAEEM